MWLGSLTVPTTLDAYRGRKTTNEETAIFLESYHLITLSLPANTDSLSSPVDRFLILNIRNAFLHAAVSNDFLLSEVFTTHESAKFVSTHCEFTHKTNADLA